MAFKLIPEEAQQQPQTNPNKSIGAQIGRHVARTGANLVGLATGLPGDIAGLLNDWVAAPIASKITGQPAIPYEETTIGKYIPTSAQTTEALRSQSPELLSPQSPVEEFADTVINDFALLAAPTKTKVPFANTVSKGRNLAKSFATSLGANLAGKGIEEWTGGDVEKGAYTKLGSLFALSLFNKPKAAQIASNMYKEAESLLPKGAIQDASKLETELKTLKTQMQKGTIAPSEKFVIDEADAVLAKIKNGQIPVEEAWASKRSLNEKLTQHLFQNPDKASQARARKLAKSINYGLKDVLKDYGQTNPKFLTAFKNSEEAFGTIAQSKFISRFIEKNIKHHGAADSALVHAIGGGIGAAAAGAGASALSGTIGPGLTAAAAYPVTQIGYRIAKSPVLRKHYFNTIKAAASEDAVVFKREYEKLKKELDKNEKKDKFKLVD